MAVKEIEYSRAFVSKTYQEDISHHGSATYVDYQKISDEDEKIRKEIREKFNFKEIGKDWEETLGFDGKILYFYRITEDEFVGRESSENKPYQTIVHVRKAGSIIDLNINELSDLERFLIDKEFKKK